MMKVFSGLLMGALVITMMPASVMAAPAQKNMVQDEGVDLMLNNVRGFNFVGDHVQASVLSTDPDDVEIEVTGTFTGTEGAVPFVDTDGELTEDNSNFFFDKVTAFLGLGTDTPSARLHVETQAVNEGTNDNVFYVTSGNTPGYRNAFEVKENRTTWITSDQPQMIVNSLETTGFGGALAFYRDGNLGPYVQHVLRSNGEHLHVTGGIFGNGEIRLHGQNGVKISENQVKAFGNNLSDASAALTVDSTTKGFLPPVMSTNQKNAIASPALGLVVFDTDLDCLAVNKSTGWACL